MSAPTAKYGIGDLVWVSNVDSAEVRVQCPDCLGRRVWMCSLPSGEAVSIPCPTCHYGWDGSRGYLTEYGCKPRPWRGTVGSIRINTADREVVAYMLEETGVGSGTIHYESRLFDNEGDALADSIKRAQEQSEAVRVANVENRARARKDRPGALVAHLRSEVRGYKKKIADTEAHIARLAQDHPRMKAQP